MSWRSETHCVTCGQRMTGAGWAPYCCEVCLDSDWADIHRWADAEDARNADGREE